MAKICNPLSIAERRSSIYPAPFNKGYELRAKRALTAALGLTQFGVNVTTLEPGGGSAERHWHHAEDECIYVLEGELTLVADDGETLLGPGMAAGFPAGDANGHHLINRSDSPATYLEIGTRAENEDAVYPDIDLKAERRGGAFRFLHKDGTPYE